jgi:hypothetical protein
MAYAYTGTVLAGPIEERIARPSLFARIVQSMIASRMRSAQRELRARGFVVNETGVILDGIHTSADDTKLPFAR